MTAHKLDRRMQTHALQSRHNGHSDKVYMCACASCMTQSCCVAFDSQDPRFYRLVHVVDANSWSIGYHVFWFSTNKWPCSKLLVIGPTNTYVASPMMQHGISLHNNW